MAILISLGLISVLGAVIYFDLRHMRIPDHLSLVLLALFVGFAFSMPLPDIGIRVVQAFCVFLVCFGAFIFRLLGGGDVKILSALSLFVPLSHASAILLGFSVALICGTTAIILLRKISQGVSSKWAFLNSSELPMGVPIGLAGLAVIGWSLVAGTT